MDNRRSIRGGQGLQVVSEATEVQTFPNMQCSTPPLWMKGPPLGICCYYQDSSRAKIKITSNSRSSRVNISRPIQNGQTPQENILCSNLVDNTEETTIRMWLQISQTYNPTHQWVFLGSLIDPANSPTGKLISSMVLNGHINERTNFHCDCTFYDLESLQFTC